MSPRGRCGLLLAGLALAATGCARAEPPDVLLVVVDTLRADRLGSYGYEAATTPQLDALAARSVVSAAWRSR